MPEVSINSRHIIDAIISAPHEGSLDKLALYSKMQGFTQVTRDKTNEKYGYIHYTSNCRANI